MGNANLEWAYDNHKSYIRRGNAYYAIGKDAVEILEQAEKACDRLNQPFVLCIQMELKKKGLLR